MNSIRRNRGLLWILPALALYLLALQRLWFNAPVWDDFDAILGSLVRMHGADSLGAFWREAVNQHNEHRIATTRLAAWSVWKLAGEVDFRVLVLLGNACLVGILALAWIEFREKVPAVLFAAAGFLMFQWSYYEASLETMAAVSNLGVVFFGFASLFFALRDGAAAAVACVAFGVLAAGSQGNGLFVLPIAAAGCALARRPRRAALIAAVAAAVWLAYFQSYVRPGHHPSPFLALSMPYDTARLFFLIMGGIFEGLWRPIAFGVLLIATLGWLVHRRFWRSHPAVALWILFILASAGAAAMARVGLGVFHAARYAINSTCLLILLLLLAAAILQPLTRARIGWTLSWAIAAALFAWYLSFGKARDFSFDGQLLAKGVPANPEVRNDRYFGEVFLTREGAESLLRASEDHGIYVPRERTIFGFAARHEQTLPPNVRRAGHVDDVRVANETVTVRGWTDLTGAEPGRSIVLAVHSERPESLAAKVTSRADVARARRAPALVYSGFQLDARFATAEAALRAAGTLCVYVVPEEGPPAVLERAGVNCTARP